MLGRPVSQASRPRVLLADVNQQNEQWLLHCLAGYYDITVVRHSQEALHSFDSFHPHIVIAGQLQDMTGAQFLAHAADQQVIESGSTAALLVGEQDEEVLAESDVNVFYVLNRSMSDTDVRSIVNRSYAQLNREPTAVHMRVHNAADATRMQRVLEVTRRLAVERDLKDAARTIVAAVTEFVQSDRAYCVYHDAKAGALWIESGTEENEGESETKPIGIAGFAARTGTQVFVDRVDEDPRYFRKIDDPAGRGDEQIIAQPVSAPGGQVHAVIVVVRERGRATFSLDERETMLVLAEHIGPLIHYLALQVETESLLEDPEADEGMFRVEALEAHSLRRSDGDVVRVSPDWVAWTYPAMIVSLIVGLMFMVFFKTSDYSSGRAFIDLGVTPVSSERAGTVTQVLVRRDQVVKQGQVMALLYSHADAANYHRARKDFEQALVNYLQDQSNEALGSEVARLRAEKDRYEVGLSITAPHAGVVADIQAYRGKDVAAQQAVFTLSRGRDYHPQVIALMPGRDLPMIKEGMDMRVQMEGYAHAYVDLKVTSVDKTVTAPQEAERYGRATIKMGQPFVVVRATLANPMFRSKGREYRFHDGMTAFAEIRIKSERIITTIIPGVSEL